MVPDERDAAAPRPETRLTPEDPETWARVQLGMGPGPVLVSSNGALPAPEDDLDRMALEDPAAEHREKVGQHSPVWPVIFLVVIAIVALAVVFWKP